VVLALSPLMLALKLPVAVLGDVEALTVDP
jgi:hypothetical protein